MVTDQLSHTMLHNTTVKAMRHGLPIIYSRRSAYGLGEKLAERYGPKRKQRLFGQFSTGWSAQLNYLAISY